MNWVEKPKLGILTALLTGACLAVGPVQGAELPTPALESEAPRPGNPSLVPLGLKLAAGEETGTSHTLSFLGQNTTSQPIEKIEVQLLLRARGGRVRSVRVFSLEVNLAPGESRFLERQVYGLSPQAGDVLVLGTSLVPSSSWVEDRSGLIASELEHLERLAGPPGEGMRGVLDGLRALEARSLKSLEIETSAAAEEDGLVNLDACLIFCLRCAQAAAILCTDGVDSLKCDCSQGICSIDCK